jgi:periplasmic divalent cation tolerance protein
MPAGDRYHGAPMATLLQVAFCTAPNQDVARQLAQAVVGERLAACVNIVAGVTSVYRWEGAVQEDEEVLLVLKTTADRRDALQARLLALHPYTVPEFFVLDASEVSAPYLEWLERSTR